MINAAQSPDDTSTDQHVRRRKEDLRDLVLSTASSMLISEGLSAGAERVTFKRVFDKIEGDDGIRITNASVIGRIWRDQAEFQRDVLIAAALDAPEIDIATTKGMVEELLRSLDLSTPELKAHALSELIRRGTRSNFVVRTESESWRRRAALWSLHVAGSSAKPDEEIGQILMASSRGIRDACIAIFDFIFERLDVKIRDPLTIQDFVLEVASVAEGLSLSETLLCGPSRHVELPTGPHGELREWNLLGLALSALAQMFLEPVTSV